MAFRDELLARLPEIVIGTLAGRLGGPQAVGAFQGGMLQRQQVEDERAQQAAEVERQAQLDEERRQQQTLMNTRADEAADTQRRQALLRAIVESEADPTALANFYGVPAEQAQAIAAPIVSNKERQAARVFIEKLEREGSKKDGLYAGHFSTPESIAALDETTVDFRGRRVKIRDIRAMTEEPVVPPKPAAPMRQSATPGSFEHYVDAPPEEQARIEAARKRYMQADDRPQPQATVLIQTVDESGRPVQRMVPRVAGSEFSVAPSASQQTAMAEQETGLALIGDIERLYKPQYIGPAIGRVTRARMQIPGAPDVPQDVAEFYASVAGLRNEIIRLMSGAAVSGSEEARMRAQLPDVTDKPSVFQAKLAQTRRNREMLAARIQARSGGAPSPPSAGSSDGWVEIDGIRIRERK